MTEMLKRKLGTRIRTARQLARLSQEALATQVKRTPESISNIERGEQLPAIDTLIALSAALDVPLSDLLQHVDDDRTISRERAENEAVVSGILRMLSDDGVAIAVQQIEALKRVR